MKLFSARLLFRIAIEGQDNDEFDEQLVVIKAESKLAALELADAKGHQKEESFVNVSGKRVYWIFIGTTELGMINLDEDLWVMAGRTLQPENAKAFEMASKKAVEKVQRTYLYPVK